MLVEGRHFLPGAEPRALGHKALAVNLSDLAAMGATPRWATLALALPAVEPAWLEAFSAGLFALAERYHVDLVGGDTTRGAAAHAQHHRDRRGARRGWRWSAPARARATTSGCRASSAAPRSAWRIRRSPRRRSACTRPSRASSSASACGAWRTRRSTSPTASPAILRTSWSARAWARACITIAFRRPRAFAALNDAELERRCVLSGGDDYELMFTAPREHRAELEALARELGLPLTRIGDDPRRRRRGSPCSTRKASRSRTAAASTTSPAMIVVRPGAGLRVLASGARRRLRLRRRARAGGAGHFRHAARLGDRLGAGRAAPRPGVAHGDGVFRHRRVGLRGHRAPPRRRRPRRDGVGRGGRLPADPRDRAARARVAGRRVRSPSASSTSPSRRRSATSSGATAAASA